MAMANNLSHCYNFGSDGEDLYVNLRFWVEGVLGVSFAILGIFFNTVTTFILSDRDMINSFNMMLIALSFIDSGYLFASILESFRKSFDMATEIHKFLFPKVLYPFHSIMLTMSIFMTVGISLERYTAVHQPVDYNQAMNDFRASLRRLFKFTVPVCISSIIFNLPKFFESRVVLMEKSDGSMVSEIDVTELRKNPTYAIYYNCWARIIITGLIPIVLLIYFNYKVYKDVTFRRQGLWQNRNAAQQQGQNQGQKAQRPERSGSPTTMRRRMEDNLAVIFIGMVTVFLICHVPRLFLGLHEAWITNQTISCAKAGFSPFPLWATIMNQFSHLVLVINSSVNCLIYSVMSSRFRKAALQRAQEWGCFKPKIESITTAALPEVQRNHQETIPMHVQPQPSQSISAPRPASINNSSLSLKVSYDDETNSNLSRGESILTNGKLQNGTKVTAL